MDCGVESAAAIEQCIKALNSWVSILKPAIELGLGLLGIGSIVSIGIMTWFLKKSRSDIERHVALENDLRASAKAAIEAQEKSEERERIANRNFKWAQEELERRKRPVDLQLEQVCSQKDLLSAKLDLLRSASGGDGAEFWSRTVDPTQRIPEYEKRLRNSIPILLFANQKGGVGKTTLSTNLAAYFAARGERVLVVDLDYQGSATALLLAQAQQRPEEFPSMVDLLFAEQLNDLWSGTAIQPAADNLDYISCWYSFEKLERHLEYCWALSDEIGDVRYRLARALLSPHIQSVYKRVIIDAPPRMTTGFINGLCASTHLFVPTVVDNVSAVAVGTFARQFKKLRDSTNTVIELSGVIGTMTARQSIPQAARGLVDVTNRHVRRAMGTNQDYFLADATMVRTQKISYSTEHGIAYLNASKDTKTMFDVIGKAVAERAPTRST